MIRFMKEKYTPVLLSSKGKALVVLGSAALLAAGIYGVTKVDHQRCDLPCLRAFILIRLVLFLCCRRLFLFFLFGGTHALYVTFTRRVFGHTSIYFVQWWTHGLDHRNSKTTSCMQTKKGGAIAFPTGTRSETVSLRELMRYCATVQTQTIGRHYKTGCCVRDCCVVGLNEACWHDGTCGRRRVSAPLIFLILCLLIHDQQTPRRLRGSTCSILRRTTTTLEIVSQSPVLPTKRRLVRFTAMTSNLLHAFAGC